MSPFFHDFDDLNVLLHVENCMQWLNCVQSRTKKKVHLMKRSNCRRCGFVMSKTKMEIVISNSNRVADIKWKTGPFCGLVKMAFIFVLQWGTFRYPVKSKKGHKFYHL